MPYPGRRARERWHEPWEEYAAQRPFGHRRMSPMARLLLPVIVSLVVQVPGVFVRIHFGPGAQPELRWHSAAPLLLNLAITLIGPLALLWARRFPGPVVAIVAAAGSADILLYSDTDRPPYIALAFAILSAVIRGARLWAWISIASAWVATLTLSIVLSISLAPPRIAVITLGILLIMGVGEAVRTRRERYAEASRRTAQRRQSEVQAERVRIARELHDVLAHSLSQINVQAGVGLHLMDRQPDKAKDALASIKETSKTALDEVRSVLGILRAEGGADPNAPLVPEPDLSRLAGLAASMSTQGLEVEVDNRLDAEPPSPAQLALYRIAQESLTNVLRHARATHATVSVGLDGGDYLLVVTDDGVGSGPPHQDSGGRGLLGMHERAELLGGRLEAGPLAEGGFRVTARIPAPTTATEGAAQ